MAVVDMAGHRVHTGPARGVEENCVIATPGGVTIPLRYWRGEPGRGAVVYVHGLMSHSGWFSMTGDWLNERACTCAAPDRRGSGRSTAPRGHVKHYDELVEDIGAVIDWVRETHPGSNVHLAGQCFGALPVLCYAARHPKTLATLTLLSPGLKTTADLTLAQKLLVGLLSYATPTYPLPVPVKPEHFTCIPGALEDIRNDEDNLSHATVRLYMQTPLMRREIARSASRIVTPTFLALAGRDGVCDNEAALAFHERLPCPDKERRVYEDSLHSLEHDTKRRAFLEDWLAWIQAHED